MLAGKKEKRFYFVSCPALKYFKSQKQIIYLTLAFISTTNVQTSQVCSVEYILVLVQRSSTSWLLWLVDSSAEQAAGFYTANWKNQELQGDQPNLIF